MSQHSDHTVGRGRIDPWQAAVATLLRRLKVGELTLVMPDGRTHVFAAASPGPTAVIEIKDPSVARRVALGGSLGLAEGYMDGAWDTPDLDAVLDLGIENVEAGWGASLPSVFAPLERLRHARRDNDPHGGARRNIAAHYDLGNDFYELWLDDTLTYSSACLTGNEAGPLTDEQLACAQRRKWDRILELLQPSSGAHLLEIGCGWGGFAMHAAKEAACRVTGLTLSEEQAALARERVREAGLEGRVEIKLEDYRHVSGTFDGIASIEMFEAVGERWWPTFFGRVRELMEAGAAAALQTITIAEERFEDYRSHPDFIQRYIFPGGMLPSPERFAAVAAGAGLVTREPRFFGLDYAHTLAAWAARFERVVPEVHALGFDDRFVRMWRYYLSYCRTGFQHGTIDVMQVRLES